VGKVQSLCRLQQEVSLDRVNDASCMQHSGSEKQQNSYRNNSVVNSSTGSLNKISQGHVSDLKKKCSFTVRTVNVNRGSRSTNPLILILRLAASVV
jgi:hypothetical protein